MSLKVSEILPRIPVWLPGRRTEKSPACIACSAPRSSSRAKGGRVSPCIWATGFERPDCPRAGRADRASDELAAVARRVAILPHLPTLIFANAQPDGGSRRPRRILGCCDTATSPSLGANPAVTAANVPLPRKFPGPENFCRAHRDVCKTVPAGDFPTSKLAMSTGRQPPSDHVKARPAPYRYHRVQCRWRPGRCGAAAPRERSSARPWRHWHAG